MSIQQFYFVAYKPETFSRVEEEEGIKITACAKKNMQESRRKEWNGAVKKGSQEDAKAQIEVIGDGGWGKRSLGHSYNSATGDLTISYLIL